MASETPREPPARPGDRIRQYEIISQIGKGGMGVVFHGRDTVLGRDVALKAPWPDLADHETVRKRFFREIRIASKLSHSNIVPVYETFVERGSQWIVMQYVDGVNLADFISGCGGLETEKILELAVQLTSALQYAHESGVLHRDITPRNILIRGESEALITDFGLAKRDLRDQSGSTPTTESDSLTGTGGVVGSVHYMSPEQALSKPIDRRSDIYSLGNVLYEMCTGQRAVNADQQGHILDAILNGQPEPISRFTYKIPEELERIVRKCIAKSCDERYQSAAELRADLVRLKRLLGMPVTRSATVKRRSIRAALGVSGIVAALALAVFIGSRLRPTPAAPRILGKPIQVTRTVEWEGEPALSPQGDRVVFSARDGDDFDIEVLDIQSGQRLALTRGAANDRNPDWFPDGSFVVFESNQSGTHSIWKVSALGGEPFLLSNDARSPTVSPDGRRLAFTRTDQTGYSRIGVVALDRPDDVRMLTSERAGNWDHDDPTWSADGRSICYVAFGGLWIVPANGGAAQQLTANDMNDNHPAWPPGNRVFFSSLRESTAALWSVDSSTGSVERLTLGTGEESHPSASRDGSRLAYATSSLQHHTMIHDMRTGRTRDFPALRGGSMPAIDSRGENLVVVAAWQDGRRNLWLQRLKDLEPEGRPTRLTELTEGMAADPTFSPDGDYVAFYRIVRGQRDLYVVPTRGGPSSRITEHSANDFHPCWAPDGSALAFSSDREGGQQIWTVPIEAGRLAGAPVRITDGPRASSAPAWSPDGARIAFVRTTAHGAEVVVVDLEGSSDPMTIDDGTNPLRIRWLDDSTLLATRLGGDRSAISFWAFGLDGRSAPDRAPHATISADVPSAAFALTGDRRIVVFSNVTSEGDIWVVDLMTN